MSKCKFIDARGCELGAEVKEQCGRQDRHQGNDSNPAFKIGHGTLMYMLEGTSMTFDMQGFYRKIYAVRNVRIRT